MKIDGHNLAVTTNKPAVIEAINHFSNQLIYSGIQADQVLIAADSHPDNLLLQLYAATYYLYAQETIYNTKARHYLLQAETLLKQVTLREKLFYQAIYAWYQRNYELALTLLITLTEKWPTDCVAGKIAEWLFYCTGQQYQAKLFLRMCHKMARKNQNHPGFLATYSFALELNKKYDLAYATAMKAMEIQPNTPWAHHTLTHVFLYTSQFNNGITMLNNLQKSWEDIFPRIRSHNNWHLALLHLANLDEIKIKQLYKEKIWGRQPQDMLEQLNAIALLWHMEIAGITITDEWQTINHYLQQHPFEYYVPFCNIHFIYALCRAGETIKAAESIQQAEHFAQQLMGNPRWLWLEITVPALKGTCAFATGDYQQAYHHLKPVMPYIEQTGDSDAQVELFLLTYLHCLSKTSRCKLAQKFYNNHLSHYDNTPFGEYLSAQIC